MLSAQEKSKNDDKVIRLGQFKWYTIEDFEDCFNWPVVNKPTSDRKWLDRDPVVTMIAGGPRALSAQRKEKCMGIKTKMAHMGDTRKFASPTRKLDIPGICQKITFWVNSRNKPVTIRIMVQDHLNYLHILEPTEYTLDHYGWKKFEITDIDKKVLMLPTTDPSYKPLKLIAFVIENPLKKVFYKKLYIYVDHFEAYCRVDEFTDYDGSKIKDRW